MECHRVLVKSLAVWGLLLSACSTASAQEDLLAKPTQAILQTVLPDKAALIVDGRDYGEKRGLSYDGLQPQRRYQISVEARLPGGSTVARKIFLSAGHVVRWVVPDPGPQPELVTSQGHTLPARALAVSPDGRWLLTGADDGQILLWDAETGLRVREFSGHKQPVTCLAFAPATDPGPPAQFVSGSGLGPFEPGEVLLWDFQTGEKAQVFQGLKGGAVSVAFSPDGKQVLAAEDGPRALLWDVASPAVKKTLSEHQESLTTASFSPDGQWLLTADQSGQVILWDRAAEQPQHTLKEHTNLVRAAAFQPGGTWLATGGDDARLLLWDLKDLTKPKTFRGIRSGIQSLEFTKDGGQLLVGSWDREAFVLDLASEKIVQRIATRSLSPITACWQTSGARAWIREGSGLEPTIFGLWDVRTGTRLHAAGGRIQPVTQVAFSADGQRLLTLSGAVRVWDLRQGIPWRAFPAEVSPLQQAAFSRDGLHVLALGARLHHYDLRQGTSAPPTGPRLDFCAGLAPGPTPNLAYVAGREVWLWDVAKGRPAALIPADEGPLAAALFSPSGDALVSASQGAKTGSLRKLPAGTVLRTLSWPSGEVTAGAFSPDGSVFALGTSTGAVRVWDRGASKVLQDFSGHAGRVAAISFAPASGLMVSAGEDGKILAWDYGTGKQLREIVTGRGPLTSISLHPAGRVLATGSRAGVARLYDLFTGDELAAILGTTSPSEWGLVSTSGLCDGTLSGLARAGWLGMDDGPTSLDRLYAGTCWPGLLNRLMLTRTPRFLPLVQAPRPVALTLVPPAPPVIPIEEAPAWVPSKKAATDTAPQPVTEPPTQTLAVTIEPRGGGLLGPWVVHNGARLDLPVESQHGPGPAKFTWTIPLVPGANQFSVSASTVNSSWDSAPARWSAEVPPSREMGKLFVCVIGMSDYPDPRLKLPAATEALALATAFSQSLRGPFSATEVEFTSNNEATSAAIHASLAKLATTVQPADTFLLAFAGRGGPSPGQPLRLWTVDAQFDDPSTGLTWPALAAAIQKVPALQRVLILDVQAPTETRPENAVAESGEWRKAIELLSRQTGAWVLGSCQPSAVAAGRPGSAPSVMQSLLDELKTLPPRGPWRTPADWFTSVVERRSVQGPTLGPVPGLHVAGPEVAFPLVGKLRP